MNDIQTSKLNMFLKVIAFGGDADNAAAIAAALGTAGAATFESLRLVLKDTVNDINEADIEATTDNSGIAETKNLDRDELMQSTRKAISQLVRLFTHTGKRLELRKVDYTKSDLEKMKDVDFRNTAKRINDTVQTNITALIAQGGYVSGDKTAFDTRLADFSEIIGTPKEKISVNTAVTAEVASLFHDGDHTIELMDIEMAPAEFVNELIFNKYKAVRATDDIGGGSGDGGVILISLNASEEKKAEEIAYDPDAVVHIEVTGTQAVIISLRNDDGTTTFGETIADPGSTVDVPMSAIGAEGSTLYAKNQSTTAGTSVKISFP